MFISGPQGFDEPEKAEKLLLSQGFGLDAAQALVRIVRAAMIKNFFMACFLDCEI